MVVLCNVSELWPRRGALWHDLLREVAGCSVFAGDRVRSGALSSSMRGRPAGRVQGPDEPGVDRLVRMEQGSSDLLEPFDQPKHRDLRGMDPSPGSRVWSPEVGARALVSAKEKHPAGRRVEQPAGDDASWLPSPADNAWGDWAIGRLYLPLIHQIVGYLADRVRMEGTARASRGTGEAQTAGVSIEARMSPWCGTSIRPNLDPRAGHGVETLRQVYWLPFSQP